jgi:hypothetical protein
MLLRRLSTPSTIRAGRQLRPTSFADGSRRIQFSSSSLYTFRPHVAGLTVVFQNGRTCREVNICLPGTHSPRTLASSWQGRAARTCAASASGTPAPSFGNDSFPPPVVAPLIALPNSTAGSRCAVTLGIPGLQRHGAPAAFDDQHWCMRYLWLGPQAEGGQ